MDGTNEQEALSIEALAAQMLGLAAEEQAPAQTQAVPEVQGHPAWKSILDAVPAEYHNALLPTLQEWDAGVSRRFQKIHDEYEPLKKFAEYDPAAVDEAVRIYEALNSDPNATWEAIGRAYGLSPQQHSQAESLEEDDFDLSDLPPALRNKLSRLDIHEEVLEAITSEFLKQKEAAEQAAEDAALEELLSDLKKERGDFDDDYVIGLMAAGVEPEDAVDRYMNMVSRFSPGTKVPSAEVAAPAPVVADDPLLAAVKQQASAPRVMSGGGGVPSLGTPDVTKLSSQDTKNLVSELLRLTQQQQ